MISKISFKLFLYLFLIIYFLIGLFIYKDFGIGIEEHFQRQNGFYWLNKLISYTNYDDFKYLVNSKYQQILLADPDLPDPEFFNFYGIIFDLPLAFIETFFDLKSSKFYFEIRHLFIFLIFFISSIYFLKILKNRFDNNSVIFLGLFFYIFSPRIFGDSFYNNKDILFLSILTISISYLFELFEKRNNKNLILFCFFAALATSTRIMGVFLPLMLFVFYFLEYLINKFSTRIFLLQSFKLFLLYIFFLYLHFPYIWELNIFNISGWFLNFFFWMDIKVLFNGDYYSIKYLPRSYLENYKTFLKSHRKIFKKRRLFIGSYSVQFDDCFKIFFAESRSNGSRYIMAAHGAGIHASRDAIYDHFYNISDKVICSSRKAIEKKKHTYVGLDIFKKLEHKNEKDKKSKILVNFHEFSKFVFRTPVTTPPFSEEVENFKKTIKGFKLLNKESKKNLRFRVKGHYGLNSKQRFAKVFGKIDSINFTDSLRESKLVVCFIPQTSYIESIYNNIPTILVGNKESFFDTSKRLKILKSLKKNNLYFDNMEQAANFINKNWNNIDFWWNSKNLQKFIKGFLKKNYDISENNYDLMKKLIKAELNKIK